MTARTRLPAGLALATAVLLTGCAGTSPEEAASSSAASSPPSATSAGSGTPPAAVTSQAPAGTRLAVTVTGGRADGDTGRVPVGLGELVTLTVASDAVDELHLHGYDLTAELVPGQPAVLTFTADIAGVFEAELHAAGTVLLSLQVG